MRLIARIFGIYCLIVFAVHAQLSPNCNLHFLSELEQIQHQSSVELEVTLFPNLMKIITTKDGTVGALIKSSELPRDFYDMHPEVAQLILDKNLSSIEQVPWDEVEYRTQMMLIQYATDKRSPSFFDNREIIGLKIKDSHLFEFNQPTVFLGKTYEIGTHEIPIGNYLGKVEYRGPTDVTERFKGVELHFRSSLSAGENSRSAATLLKLLDVQNVHQHVHMVGELPFETLAKKGEVQAILMGDFFRRANLMAEMHASYFERRLIKKVESEGVLYFSYLEGENLKGVTDYFLSLAKGDKPVIGDRYKMGFAGMRGFDKYDQPGLWGIEYRSISKDSDPEKISVLLNSIQQKMFKGEFGSIEKMQRWLTMIKTKNPQNGAEVSSYLKNQWYHKEWSELLSSHQPVDKQYLEFLEKISKDQDNIKMIFHDWSHDPMIFDQPQMIARVQAAQKHAKKLLEDRFLSLESDHFESSRDIIWDFYKRSGLMEYVYQSFNISF